MELVLENRKTWLEINIPHFLANLDEVKKLAGEKEIWAVVKADCYHHGLEILFQHFLQKNITKFCVAQVDEAIYLQNIANKENALIEILIMGQYPLDHLNQIKPNWHISISSKKWIDMALQEKIVIKNIAVHLKVDSGMNRRGMRSSKEFAEVYRIIEETEKFNVVGAYTHFATADTNQDYMEKQYNHFVEVIADYKEDLQYIHCENSAGSENYATLPSIANMCRPGAICYGLSCENEKIIPIASLYSEIEEVRSIESNIGVSYGHTEYTKDAGIIGIMPIGYADGLIRKNQGRSVYADGKFFNIIGRICMEQTMIFAPQMDDFAIGSVIELFGENVKIAAVAEYLETIDYEIMCLIASRVFKKIIK